MKPIADKHRCFLGRLLRLPDLWAKSWKAVAPAPWWVRVWWCWQVTKLLLV